MYKINGKENEREEQRNVRSKTEGERRSPERKDDKKIAT
jgi:hypothetical protein